MKKKPETLTQLHTTFSQKIQSRLKEDINELVTDLDLKNKLDFLDKLDTEQSELSQGETVWYENQHPQQFCDLSLGFTVSIFNLQQETNR